MRFSGETNRRDLYRDGETEPVAEACMLSTRSNCRFDAEFSLFAMFVKGLVVVATTMPHRR